MFSRRFSGVLGLALLTLFNPALVDAKMAKPGPVLAAAETGPERVETTTYHSWIVSCREILGAASRKTCSAMLRVIDQSGHPLMAWVIALDGEGKLTSLIRTPTGVTLTDKSTGAKFMGLMVKEGVNLELGKTAIHHLDYLLCEPQWCEASGLMDERFVKDAVTATDAVVIIYAAGGRAVRYAALPLKGIDKAILMVRR